MRAKKNHPDIVEIFDKETLDKWKSEQPKRVRRLRCVLCEELFNPEETQFVNAIGGKKACWGCYEYAEEHAEKLIEFDPNYDKEYYYLDSKLGDLTNMEPSFPTPIKSIRYVNTDGWRGYTTWDLMDGYISLTDGWITGYPDSTTTRKMAIGEMYEKFDSDEMRPPVTMWWMFGTTSNIFSTSCSIIIAESDKEKFCEWLKDKFDYTTEDLDYMMS